MVVGILVSIGFCQKKENRELTTNTDTGQRRRTDLELIDRPRKGLKPDPGSGWESFEKLDLDTKSLSTIPQDSGAGILFTI